MLLGCIETRSGKPSPKVDLARVQKRTRDFCRYIGQK